MIFTGDVAIADGDQFEFFGFPDDLLAAPICINLEGAVKADDKVVDAGVYNSESGLESLSCFNCINPFIANNHIHDLYDGVVRTCEYFEKRGVRAIGAGRRRAEAEQPVFIDSGGFKYAVLGFGWSVIGCVPCSGDTPGVNEFNRDNVLRSVNRLLEEGGEMRIVVVIHGNYEFEPYPQPGHRKLALELVDMGVYSVIFHHPHIVGPIERYKNRTIAYSLGNFAFSQGRFFMGGLVFPERSFHQILIELGEGDKVHHCYFNPPSMVVYDKVESCASANLSLKAEFEGYSDGQYLEWFKKNRHKDKFLPIYKSADKTALNHIKDTFVLLRQRVISCAVLFGLKGLERK